MSCVIFFPAGYQLPNWPQEKYGTVDPHHQTDLFKPLESPFVVN